MSEPEFSRPERIDAIGTAPRVIEVAADAGECAALAARFGLVEVGRLAASYAVRREVSGIIAEGRVQASVVQACVVTGEPLSAIIDEAVALCFVAKAEMGDEISDDEIELTSDALDIIPFRGGAIDLGEAAAETMALALDPFPRSPGAASALREAGVLREEEAGPFGGLAALKALLPPKD